MLGFQCGGILRIVVPSGVNVFRVAQAITTALRGNGIKGPVQITAFGAVLQLSWANQEALSSTGINFAHIPNVFFLLSFRILFLVNFGFCVFFDNWCQLSFGICENNWNWILMKLVSQWKR